jgi:hypothetical protein
MKMKMVGAPPVPPWMCGLRAQPHLPPPTVPSSPDVAVREAMAAAAAAPRCAPCSSACCCCCCYCRRRRRWRCQLWCWGGTARHCYGSDYTLAARRLPRQKKMQRQRRCCSAPVHPRRGTLGPQTLREAAPTPALPLPPSPSLRPSQAARPRPRRHMMTSPRSPPPPWEHADGSAEQRRRLPRHHY